ncbi:MAG: hypothetical protein WCH43_16445, partial [Verrucomicrobiota bacterium]
SAATPLPVIDDGSGTKGSGTLSYSENREHFERELIEDLHSETIDAATLLPTAPEIEKLQSAVDDQDLARGNHATLDTKARTIIPALDGVIQILRNGLQAARRKFQLTSRDPSKAPAAYREAVADYFEQLSRDYEAEKK